MKYTIKEILAEKKHRSWSYPTNNWMYYQEWNNALFFHYKINPAFLKPFIPANLELDILENNAWISLVAFKMENIRPRFLPSFPPISNFGEINLRTYVTKDNKPGVYFLTIEAEKLFSAILAKSLSDLPYEKSTIKRTKNSYKANHPKRDFILDATYNIGNHVENKTDLDLFLTERYCLYLDKNDELFRYEIQHLPWKINELNCTDLTINYQLDEINLHSKPDLMHYSEGVQVVALEKVKL